LAWRSASKTGSAASRRKWNWQSWCGTPGRARSTARRIEVCPSLTTPSTGTPRRRGHLAQQRREVLGRGGEQAARQQHLAREAVAHHPEHLVPDVGLRAVQR
jgi:hypothetical protein